MSIGLVGKKCGMTRIFTETGESVPVTLIEATPNRITQVKTAESDGYNAVQVTAGSKRAALVNKPQDITPRPRSKPAVACGSSASTPRRLASTASVAN